MQQTATLPAPPSLPKSEQFQQAPPLPAPGEETQADGMEEKKQEENLTAMGETTSDVNR